MASLACPYESMALIVSATMPVDEWWGLQLTYKDTLKTLQGCTGGDDAMTCNFKLGHYENYKSLGMSGPWQQDIGWVSKGGNDGTRSMTMAWA